jgi:hypothetical protein
MDTPPCKIHTVYKYMYGVSYRRMLVPSVRLPPGREIKLTLELERNVNTPSYMGPWERSR